MSFLKKLFGKRKALNNSQGIFEIIGDYGAFLEQPTQFFIASLKSILPFIKEKIKNTIKAALFVIDDKTTIENLKKGYTLLAEFIPEQEAKIE